MTDSSLQPASRVATDPQENAPVVAEGGGSATCVDPSCESPATTAFVGHKSGREPLTFRTCRDHKFPVSLGLVRFGLADSIEYGEGA